MGLGFVTPGHDAEALAGLPRLAFEGHLVYASIVIHTRGMSVPISTSMSICLYLSLSLSLYLSIYPSISLSIYLSLSLYIYIYIYIYISPASRPRCA